MLGVSVTVSLLLSTSATLKGSSARARPTISVPLASSGKPASVGASFTGVRLMAMVPSVTAPKPSSALTVTVSAARPLMFLPPT